MEKKRVYIAIDLKSFYASAECKEINVDPLDHMLVVADESRTDKTICLAVSPALKSFGISGRARLFEVKERLREINRERRKEAPNGRFKGKSKSLAELEKDKSLELEVTIARPRMALYIEYSKRIYGIYLRYISPDDIHVYSIDEVFIDATDYLSLYHTTAHDFAMKLILEVLKESGITATAGIGSNMYLAKVAMDIKAKHIKADENGVRIAELDETSYRKTLWEHKPLTDFWRLGHGIASHLERLRLYTMKDIALCSIGDDDEYYNEDLLFKEFGKNAELLIDHAWGREPCRMCDIKSYRSKATSLGSGQVLQRPYSYEEAKTVLKEMADSLSLDLVSKEMVTPQIVIYIGYDIENLKDPNLIEHVKDGIREDHYGRKVPMYAQKSAPLMRYTSSSSLIISTAEKLFDEITNKALLIRRINITAINVISENDIPRDEYQLDLFVDYDEIKKTEDDINSALEKEKSLQKATLGIKGKFGKNAILRGISYTEGSTAKERNNQIGGHKA